jgi:Arc/MetJ-type ribon-helix-helix transcriptional regulator
MHKQGLHAEQAMRRIKIKLNQQQLELMDRAVVAGMAPDRAALIRKALREHAANAGWTTGITNRRPKP